MTEKYDQLTTDAVTRRAKLLAQERLILEVTESISRLLEAEAVSRTKLAERLGTSAAYVTKLLSGENNFTLRTLSDVFFELNRTAHLEVGPLGEPSQLPREFTHQVSLLAEWHSIGSRGTGVKLHIAGVDSVQPGLQSDDYGMAA